MNQQPKKWWSGLFRTALFTSKGFLIRATVITIAFLLAQLIGLREYTTILSGTSPSGDVTDVFSNVLGVIYIIFYFSFVLIVPILVLASIILNIFQSLLNRKRSKVLDT